MLACVAWLVANSVSFTKTEVLTVHDWTSSGWANAYLPFLFLQCVGYWGQSVSHCQKHQRAIKHILRHQYVYWLLSCFATDVQSNARNGGIFRFWEAVGQAISYGVSSRKELGISPLYGCLVVIAFQAPFTWYIIRSVPLYRSDDHRRPEDEHKDTETNKLETDSVKGMELAGREGDKDEVHTVVRAA